ncbi:hypothetical protein K505DRAFT_295976 [Melanomma pulvis-pyrius CBS 109.77]|uniref:Kelch repeat protein n=1 Tax=Melanomma pulvis-pyrius CBS 109.77 TaxID=1314802 RepID=A0A6A6XQN6_9PLEO|nr:hypothetical protein K505DRAFT_295976 [Melanomma pulvis-pyrius CBS 109.77]
MKISVSPLAIITVAFSVLLQHGTAQISLTVDLDDLDPLKECNRRDVKLVESNNKVYMYGGETWVKNGTSTPIIGVNHYLRIADFTSARNMNDSAILIAKDIPGQITIFGYGAFWSDSNKLYIVGGAVIADPYLTQEGKFIDTEWTVSRGGTVFIYDINADKWSSESAVQPDNGDDVTDSFCCGAFAWNAKQRKAYYYSGSNWGGARMSDPNATPYAVVRNSGDVTGNGNLLSFDTPAFKWTNQTTDNKLTTTWTESGQYVYLPGTESPSGGVGVIFGGNRVQSNTLESLRKVLVYDSGRGIWYSQLTTAEGDQFPPNRVNFCSVAASAPDNSSHNIYMYGGEAPGQTPDAFSDMWILSIPSFHWIPVGVNSVPRKGLSCTRVAERYMVTYSGLQGGWEVSSDGDQCDQENYGLRLFDLSSLEWQSRYNGPENSAYTVPSVVYKAVGGTEGGGATQTAPSAGFNTPGLESLFKKPATTSPASSPTSSTTSGGKSNVGAIAGGVIGGVALLAALIIGAWFLLKRRKARGAYTPAATSAQYEADGAPGQLSELHGNGQEGKPVYEIYGRVAGPSTQLPPQELYADNAFPPSQNVKVVNEGYT